VAVKRKQPGREFEASDERGSSLLGILSVVAILGILVAITLSLSLGGSTSPTPAPPNSGTTTTTAPKDVASGASEATLAACEANFAVVDSAVETYRAVNGSSPPAGTAWATSDTNGGALMQSWPSAPKSYAITWNGQELSVIPVKGVAAHGSLGSQALKTGCYAL
jgi:hypothetical protein